MPTLTLSVTDSPRNRIVKNTQSAKTYVCTFKYPFSIVSPTILLAEDNINLSYNYAVLRMKDTSSSDSVNDRYYFVTDIVSVRQNLWEIHLKEDVLSTFKDGFSDTKMFVERTSNDTYFDKNIYDPIAPKEYVQRTSKTYAYLYHHSPTAVTTDVTDFLQGMPDDYTQAQSKRYVIVVARTSRETTIGDPITGTGLPLRNDILDKALINNPAFNPSVLCYCCDYTSVFNFIRHITGSASEASSVIGIYRYPYEIPHASTEYTSVWLGGKEVEIGGGSVFYAIRNECLLMADFDWRFPPYRDSWERGDVSTDLYLPYVGLVNIGHNLVRDNDEIQVVYIPFYSTNECLVAVCDVTQGTLLFTTNAPLGVQLPIGVTNAEQIRDTWTKLGISSSVSLITDSLKLMFGGSLAKLSAVRSIGSNVSSIVTTATTTHDTTNIRIYGTNESEILERCVYIEQTRPVFTETADDQDFANLYGVPMMKISTINTLAVTDNIDIKDVYAKFNVQFIPSIDWRFAPNETESAEIINALNSGILIPKVEPTS